MHKLFKSSFVFLFVMTVQQNASADILESKKEYLFGDWAGKRSGLAAQGVKFNANVSLDAAYLADGGRTHNSSPEYASQLLLGTVVDMDKLIGLEDVIFRGTITARQGQSLSAESISDPTTPQLSNVQSSFGRGNSKSRLTELSIEKFFKDINLNVKFGRFGIGNDFDVMTCDFQNFAFCSAQMGKWQSGIWMNSPVSQWAMRFKYHLNPELFTQLGIYEYNPQNALERHGWNLNTEQADGVTIPIEVIWQPKQFVNDLSGSYRIGMMYNTAHEIKNQKDIRTGERQNHTYGTWFAMDQQLNKAEEGSSRGLYTFANLTFHSPVTSKIISSQQFGFKYVGLLSSQPEDILGFGINRIQLNSRFQQERPAYNKDAEYNMELNYSYYPSKWLMLRPNIQYVIHPGASDRAGNALVLGFTSKVTF